MRSPSPDRGPRLDHFQSRDWDLSPSQYRYSGRRILLVLKYLVKMYQLDNVEITTRHLNGILCSYGGVQFSYCRATSKSFTRVVVASWQRRATFPSSSARPRATAVRRGAMG